MSDVRQANVLESPALDVLLQLEAAGFQLGAVGDRVSVKPISKLTADQRATLERHRTDVLALLRCCDPGVADCRDVFRRQIEAAGRVVLPALLYRPHIPYTKGICFSCAEPNGRASFGRCWRCSLAQRLAVGASIPAELFAAYDEAGRVA